MSAASRLTEREHTDAPLFDPTDLRIHPFTSVKDWTGDNKPDGVEALLEFQDRFRDPTKAKGTALFELYDYRRNHPDPRGERLAAWRGALQTLEEQRTRWNRISRTYSFQLAYPAIRPDRKLRAAGLVRPGWAPSHEPGRTRRSGGETCHPQHHPRHPARHPPRYTTCATLSPSDAAPQDPR